MAKRSISRPTDQPPPATAHPETLEFICHRALGMLQTASVALHHGEHELDTGNLYVTLESVEKLFEVGTKDDRWPEDLYGALDIISCVRVAVDPQHHGDFPISSHCKNPAAGALDIAIELLDGLEWDIDGSPASTDASSTQEVSHG